MAPRIDPDQLAGLNLRYDAATDRFHAVIPEFVNISEDWMARHAVGPGADRPALVFEAADGDVSTLGYAELNSLATRLAVSLRGMGVDRGQRVAVHSGSRPETVIAHMAVYKLGAIVVTLSQLFGPDTMLHALEDSGAQVIVTQDEVWEPMRSKRSRLPALEHCLVIGETAPGEIAFSECLTGEAVGFLPVRTRADDPALLIYTSGSTGMPKGVLHGHRIIHGYQPTLELFYNLELREPDLVFWTPADWAWIGGWIDVVMPGLIFGHTVVASQHRFDAEWALEFMARHGITHTLITPTALKRLAQVERPRERFDLKLRTIFTGGEALPGETLKWLNQELGVVCNEGYGMSEVNQMIGNCQCLRPIKPGSMGWIMPGHSVALVDEDGGEVADGEVGEIVTGTDAPTLFLGYWGRPDLTEETRLGPWVRTRDLAVRDADGYFWYRGRSDDLINSSGYRIGPAEVEESLSHHPAVADVGVIGVPDPNRGAIVKAFVKLANGWEPGDDLVVELQRHVKTTLAAYKYPRQVEFLDDLPTTSTGKVSRAELRRQDS